MILLTFYSPVYDEDYGGYGFRTGAEVALLSRNIEVAGDADSVSDKFGGRILVSQTVLTEDFVYGQLQLSGKPFTLDSEYWNE